MEKVVIIPAYNEELTIEECIISFSKQLPNEKIIVIDNNSTDNTYKIAKETIEKHGIKGFVLQEKRQGKGIAIRTALISIKADIYIMVDADLTYPANELDKLLKPIENNEADIVVGDRISSGGYHQQNKRPFHNFGNQIVTNLINSLYGTNLSDVMSGYRVFNRKFASTLPLLYNGFQIETEMTLFTLDKRFRILEIPVSYYARPGDSISKLNTVRDGIRVLNAILILFRDYKPLQFFSILSAFFLIIGLIVGYFPVNEYIQYQYVYKVPSAILAAGLVILSFISLSTGLILNTVVSIDKRAFEIRIKQL